MCRVFWPSRAERGITLLACVQQRPFPISKIFTQWEGAAVRRLSLCEIGESLAGILISQTISTCM